MFGPVLDPRGAWGLGILEADTPRRRRPTSSNSDPAILPGHGFSYEILPMMTAHSGDVTANRTT